MAITRRTVLKSSVLWAAGTACGRAQQPAGAVAAIWAVNDGEKIDRDDLANPNKAGNSVWDGERVRLFGARNEIVAFQVIVEAGETGIEALRLRLPFLRHSASGRLIRYEPPGTDPTDTVGRPIQIFSENYMYIPEPGTATWIYRPGTPAAPKNIVGWKPVQLVPENALPGRGGLPLRVAPRRNQAFWIEIYLAKDLPAGIYEGEIEVEADGATTAIPVELELFRFALPDENSLRPMFYYEPDQNLLYQGRNLDAGFHRFAHRHRVELVRAYSEQQAEAARGRFDGSDFVPALGYEGPGEGMGNRILPFSFYGPPPELEVQASAWRVTDAWMEFIDRFLPEAITFVYMPDEPGPDEFPRIRRMAANIKSNPGPGRRLPVLVTREYTPELEGAIDIWCCSPQRYDIQRAEAERAKGRRYWIYNGGRPQAGAIVIEAPATDPRSIAWACFKHGIDVYFYWHTVHWKHNWQKQGDRIQNVWANPITFDSRDGQGHGAFAYGDGVLIYPGTERLHPEEDRGIPGPVGTVQLANFRRGFQDHLYLTMARGLGLDQVVEETLAAVVPSVFSDAGIFVGFAEDGDTYEAARRRLGQAIEEALFRKRAAPGRRRDRRRSVGGGR